MSLLVLQLWMGVTAVGCGEYFTQGSTGCTDWQCSRSILVGNLTFCVRGKEVGGLCAGGGDCYPELECISGVCARVSTDKVAWKGYVAVGVAALFFGSNFLPVKKIKTGNGILFQQFMSLGILLVGICAQLSRGCSVIYPLSMLGGMLWALGNCMSVIIIRFLGMGLAVTTWSCSNMILGWASGHFGFWDITREEVQTPWMSYCGVGIAALSIIVFGVMEPTSSGQSRVEDDSCREPDTDYSRLNEDCRSMPSKRAQGSSGTWYDQTTQPGHALMTPSSFALSHSTRRLLGFSLAIVAGIFYGFTFDPSQSMMDHYSTKSLSSDVKYSPDGLDYVFSCFLGIFATSTSVCILFHVFQRWLPTLVDDSSDIDVHEMFVPAVISGVMWGIASVAWFVANTNLGLVMSFPLIAIGPSLVASLWGALLFGEIRGMKNIVALLVVFLLRGLSCFFTVYARDS